jgi:integrase
MMNAQNETPSFRQVFFKLANVSHLRRPRSLRVPALVVLNEVAQSIIEDLRGVHPEWVFTFRGHPMFRMNNSAWRKARERACLPHARVHDLKHTFGRRLRAVGVSFEDRQALGAQVGADHDSLLGGRVG